MVGMTLGLSPQLHQVIILLKDPQLHARGPTQLPTRFSNKIQSSLCQDNVGIPNYEYGGIMLWKLGILTCQDVMIKLGYLISIPTGFSKGFPICQDVMILSLFDLRFGHHYDLSTLWCRAIIGRKRANRIRYKSYKFHNNKTSSTTATRIVPTFKNKLSKKGLFDIAYYFVWHINRLIHHPKQRSNMNSLVNKLVSKAAMVYTLVI